MDTSPRQLARIAGGLYLINIVGGAFAIGFVRSTLLVSGDPAATAYNIRAHELLYRSGLAAHLVVTVTNVPLAVIFYDLFKVVNRRLALLDACFILVGTAIEAAGLVNEFGPLVAARVQALAYFSNDLSGIGYDIHTVFFGCDAICVAYLIVRSTFLPSGVGVLMAIDGLAYLLYSFADVLAPGFAAHLVPWIQLPALISEGSLCLWLLVVGVDVERWRARACGNPDAGHANEGTGVSGRSYAIHQLCGRRLFAGERVYRVIVPHVRARSYRWAENQRGRLVHRSGLRAIARRSQALTGPWHQAAETRQGRRRARLATRVR